MLFGSYYWSFELQLNTLITKDKAKSLKNLTKHIFIVERCWLAFLDW